MIDPHGTSAYDNTVEATEPSDESYELVDPLLEDGYERELADRNNVGQLVDANGDFFPESVMMEDNGWPKPPPRADWAWQVLPEGVIYTSYLAGPKEPRFATVFWHDRKLGWNLDYTVGGRLPLVRYGLTQNLLPEGFQVDLEGAAFPRVNLSKNMDLDAADYRVGIPLTYGRGKWRYKFAFYHLSAHVGDEFLVRNPGFQRINYLRDALVAGASWYPIDGVRLYGETGWAFNIDGGAQPWEFQFGLEYSPLWAMQWPGSPFLAVNAHLFQELNFGGNFTLQTGWQWRGPGNGHLLRTGLHYLAGKSNQGEFFRQGEQQLGLGVWYDF